MIKKENLKSFIKKHIWALIITILLVIALFPVYVGCKVPSYSCASGPTPDGYYKTSFDIEPSFVVLIERATGEDFPVKYFSWVKYHKISR